MAKDEFLESLKKDYSAPVPTPKDDFLSGLENEYSLKKKSSSESPLLDGGSSSPENNPYPTPVDQEQPITLRAYPQGTTTPEVPQGTIESPTRSAMPQDGIVKPDSPPNLAQIQLENMQTGQSEPFMDWDKKIAESSWDYIVNEGLNSSLVGLAYKAKNGRSMSTVDVSDYKPSTPEKIASSAMALLIDLPAFGPGGWVGGTAGKIGVRSVASIVLNQAKKTAIKEGLSEAAAKKLVGLTAKNFLTHPASVLSQSMSKSAGALGFYGGGTDIIRQVADGKDIEDVDYGQSLKVFGEQSVLGALVGGIGYGTAAANKAVGKVFTGTARGVAQAGVKTAGFGVENVAFVTGGAMLEGKPIKDITAEDWVMSFGTLGILKGYHAAGKFIKSNNFTKDKVNIGEFNIEFTPEERRAIERIGYDSDAQIFGNVEKIMADPQVPQTAKMKLGWATEGIKLNVIPGVSGVFITPVDGKYNVSSTNKSGEIVSSKDFSTREEADAEAVKSYSIIKDARAEEVLSSLTPKQKDNAIEQLMLGQVNLRLVGRAKDKLPQDRTPEEVAELEKFNATVDRTANEPIKPEVVEEGAEGELQNTQSRLGLPTKPEIFTDERAEEIIGRIERGEPVLNEDMDYASTQLYGEYKRLSNMKHTEGRKFTVGQINAEMNNLSAKIEYLENAKEQQLESGEFITETKPITDRIDKLNEELTSIDKGSEHPAVKKIKAEKVKAQIKEEEIKLQEVVAPEIPPPTPEKLAELTKKFEESVQPKNPDISEVNEPEIKGAMVKHFVDNGTFNDGDAMLYVNKLTEDGIKHTKKEIDESPGGLDGYLLALREADIIKNEAAGNHAQGIDMLGGKTIDQSIDLLYEKVDKVNQRWGELESKEKLTKIEKAEQDKLSQQGDDLQGRAELIKDYRPLIEDMLGIERTPVVKEKTPHPSLSLSDVQKIWKRATDEKNPEILNELYQPKQAANSHPFPQSKEKDVFFHGTPHGEFDNFDISKRGEGADSKGFGDFGNGFYFTKDKKTAQEYADGLVEEKVGDKPFVMQVHLDIKNPLDLSKLSTYHRAQNRIARERGNMLKMTDADFEQARKEAGLSEKELELMEDIEGTIGDNWGDFNVAKQLKEQGYDAIISHDKSEYVVFDKEQIKKVKPTVAEKPASFSLDNQDTFYHATSKKVNGRLIPNNAKQFGSAVYLSTDKKTVTEEFGENVHEVKLNITNPVYTSSKEWSGVQRLAIEKADKEYGEKNNLKLEEDQDYHRYDKNNLSEIDEIPSKHISDAAKELGYDAIIDKGSSEYGNEIAVLDANKIQYPKSKPVAEKPAEVTVKPLAFGEGGTKGTFIDEQGQVYKSVVRTIPEFVDGKAVRTPKPEFPTQEHEILTELQDIPNVIRVGKMVKTNEGDAFEVEKLKDSGEITYDEYRKIEQTVEEINKRNIQIGDHVSVMRRENGELVINDFSTAQKDRTDARDSDYLGRLIDKLNPQDKDVVLTENNMMWRKDHADIFLKPKGVYEYYLTQRPPSIGTHPMKERTKDIEEVEYNGRKAYLLTYDTPLTEREIYDYELTPKYDPALYIGREVKGYTLKTDKAFIYDVKPDNSIVISTHIDGKEVTKEVSGKYFNQQMRDGKFTLVDHPLPARNGTAEVKPQTPKPNEKAKEKGQGLLDQTPTFTTQGGERLYHDGNVIRVSRADGTEIPPRLDRVRKGKTIFDKKQKKNIKLPDKGYTVLNPEYQKAVNEYVNSVDLDKGESAFKEGEEYPSDLDQVKHIAENSTSPREIAEAYISERDVPTKATEGSAIEEAINKHMKPVIGGEKDNSPGSFRAVMAKANITPGMRMNWFRKDGAKLDQLALDASGEFKDETSVTPEMVADFIVRYPNNGDYARAHKNTNLDALKERFEHVTGLPLDAAMENRVRLNQAEKMPTTKQAIDIGDKISQELVDEIKANDVTLDNIDQLALFLGWDQKFVDNARKYLENENQERQSNPGSQENNNVPGKSEPPQAGTPGPLQREATNRIAEIDREIEQQQSLKQAKIDAINNNVELPIEVGLKGVQDAPESAISRETKKFDDKITLLEREKQQLLNSGDVRAEGDKAQQDLFIEPTTPTVEQLQTELAQGKWAGRITEYGKAMEQARKSQSIKERADEIAARIKKQGYDAIDDMTMMAILPYQKQIMKGGVWVTAEAVKLGGNIAEAVQKGVAKIRELCKDQKISQEETDKLIRKFEGLPQWKDLDTKKVQKDIDETVGVRNKLKQDYRNLKDKLFQSEQGLKSKTKTEAFEKGAKSRNKEVSKLTNQAGKLRAELETLDDVRSQISKTIEDNSDIIRKLTGQKTGTLIRRVNNARNYRDLEKVLNYVEKVTTDIAFKETANDIAASQKEIRALIKKNEYSKGIGKGYLGWAKELANIPKDKLADIPEQMLSDLRAIAEELSRNKVSDVANVQKFFDDYRGEMDKVYADANVEKVVSSDSMDGLLGNVIKLTKIDPASVSSIEDIVQLKRNLSLVKNKIDRLMVQEDITYDNGKFYDRDGNVIDKYSELAKSYDDATRGESVQGLFSVLNDIGIEGLSEGLLKQVEQTARKQWADQAKENWKDVDWENFTPEQKEVITWLKSNSKDKALEGLSLGELDTYAKVIEQLTYGNMPRKLVDVASTIDVLKKYGTIDTDFVNVIRASAAKSKYVRKRLLNEENAGDLLKDLARKKDMTDIDEKYGIAGKHSHPVFEIFNTALLEPIEMLNKARDVRFKIGLSNSPFAKGFKSEFKTNRTKEVADREVNALRVMMTWQANIPDAKVESIMKVTGLSKEQVLSYWEISESEWGKRYIADAKNSKGYDAQTRKMDREAYQNLKKRNGGKSILFDLSKSDQEIIDGSSHLLSKEQHKFLNDLSKGYADQLHEMKVNAVKRNIQFGELRMYDPFFIFDKPVDDAGNAQQFIDAALLDRTAPHTKSGNVNERTFDFHISKMGATDKFRQYTLTNLLNYYMADPLYNTVRALNLLKGKTESVNTPGESPKKYLSTEEVQVVSELAEGLRTRFTNVYATKVNRGVGSRILIKVLGTGAKMGRVSLLDPSRLIKDTAGNQLTALGQLPVSQWKDYAGTMLKLDKAENQTLEVLHNESGFREAERYYSEYSDSNEATKKGLYVLSFNDRATQKRIFLNEFNHAFQEFTGKEFDTNRWLTDADYKDANMDQFKRASAEAKWMAYDTFPSMEKIVKKAQDGGAGDIMLNYMQTWQIRESLRFIKQAKNFALGTNEGRAEATKKISSFLASQTAFASIGVVQMAGLSWAASAVVGLWDEETSKKLKENAIKGISKLKDPSFWYALPAASITQLTLGSFGNLNRAGQVFALSIINSTHPANKKPEWLKDLNNYAMAAFYVKPIEWNGYSDSKKNLDAYLQFAMAAQSMLQAGMAAGISLTDVGKKVIKGESLSKSEYDAWNLARSVHLVLATMYGYPGAGTIDKLMTRISNAEKPKSKKKSGGVIR